MVNARGGLGVSSPGDETFTVPGADDTRRLKTASLPRAEAYAASAWLRAVSTACIT